MTLTGYGFWLTAFLGLGSRYLRNTNRFLTYANKDVVPFHILHQTVIVAIGFLIRASPGDVLPKYFVSAVSSFTLIVILYEYLVRRINTIRNLFGMKKKKYCIKEAQMNNICFEACHIFQHYLEYSISEDEWKQRTVEGL